MTDHQTTKEATIDELVNMVRSKWPAPAAKVAAAAPRSSKKAAPKEAEPKKAVSDDSIELFTLGKINPNVRGFRGYARAQILHLHKNHPNGFTKKQFREALVNNAAKAEVNGEPTVGWAKHNFPTWSAANAWIVPTEATATEEVPVTE